MLIPQKNFLERDVPVERQPSSTGGQNKSQEINVAGSAEAGKAYCYASICNRLPHCEGEEICF